VHGFEHGDWATIIAAGVAALVVVVGYIVAQAQARQERRAKAFAEALGAVEDYMECPYRIRRRPNSDPATRQGITSAISDIQSRIAFHEAWLQVETPLVAGKYSDLVRAARKEAGSEMQKAWLAPPLGTDAATNLGERLDRPKTDAARTEVVSAMRRQLHLLHFPWR